MLISVVSSLVCVCVFFFSFFCYLCFILELKTAEGWFFQRVHLCIWAMGGYELGTLSMQVHNLLTVHNNSWALKFDNFSEFQNVIKDSPPPSPAPLTASVIMTLCVRTSIFDSPLIKSETFLEQLSNIYDAAFPKTVLPLWMCL